MTNKTNNFSLKKRVIEKVIINFQDAQILRVFEETDVLMKITEE